MSRRRAKVPREGWRLTRGIHLMTYPECRICGALSDLHVHHVRYRGIRGLSEKPGDLMTLCAHHHNDLHRRLGNRPSFADQMEYVSRSRLIGLILSGYEETA